MADEFRTIDVKGIGPLKFPSSMSDDEIEAAIKEHPKYSEPSEATSPKKIQTADTGDNSWYVKLLAKLGEGQMAGHETEKAAIPGNTQVARGLPIAGALLDRYVPPSEEEKKLIEEHPTLAKNLRTTGAVAGGVGQALATGPMGFLAGGTTNAIANMADTNIRNPNAGAKDNVLSALLGYGGQWLNRLGGSGASSAAKPVEDKVLSTVKQVAQDAKPVAPPALGAASDYVKPALDPRQAAWAEGLAKSHAGASEAVAEAGSTVKDVIKDSVVKGTKKTAAARELIEKMPNFDPQAAARIAANKAKANQSPKDDTYKNMIATAINLASTQLGSTIKEGVNLASLHIPQLIEKMSQTPKGSAVLQYLKETGRLGARTGGMMAPGINTMRNDEQASFGQTPY
jgi:hypothetical protein